MLATATPARREQRGDPRGWVSSSVRAAWPSRIVKPVRNQQRHATIMSDDRKPWEIPVEYTDIKPPPRQVDPVAPEDEELEGEEIYDDDDIDDVDDGDDWDDDIDEVS